MQFAIQRLPPCSINVSIPFKRESVSELANEEILKQVLNAVSIPFKRESVSERVW